MGVLRWNDPLAEGGLGGGRGMGMRHQAGARGRRTHRRPERRGLTLLEVTIALTIVATVLMVSVGAFGSSIKAVNSAQRRSRATVFLQTIMEDVSAQPYDNLLAFNGNRFMDQATAARSNYAVDLSVFVVSLDLEQVQGVLTDLRTNREIGRVTTLRSRR